MPEVILGALALAAIVGLLYAFTRADAKTLVRWLRYLAVAGLGLVAICAFAFDRPGIGVFVATLAWSFFTKGHFWPSGAGPFGHRGARRASSGQTSTVRTAWLAMTLTHDSGEMDGEVLQGAYAGKRLSTLDRAALLALWQEAQQDGESLRLLETYLDRRFGADWGDASQKQQAGHRADTGMTRAEALRILDLEEGAGEAAIRTAHRRLMMQMHPDRGGSDYLAAKINEAKDVLLRG